MLLLLPWMHFESIVGEQEDTSIPVRKGKDGKPTKKQLRDELAEKMRSSLKELGDKGGWTCGKW